MGYIQAVYDLGLIARGLIKNDSRDSGISSYLQLPMPEITDEKRSGREIRVWLTVDDKDADILNVSTVARLDICEYPRVSKEKYLYREPVSSAATWRFSPIYKLGKGVSGGQKELIGIGNEQARQEMMEWLQGIRLKYSSIDVKKEVKDNRYFKLKNALLDAFEEEKAFTPGSVNRIMQYFIEHIDDVANFWTDTNRSYILIFGLDVNGRFVYPGEVPAFRKYFAKKLNMHLAGNSIKENMAGRTKKSDRIYFCAICGEQTSSVITVDKLFVFATFDKASFLPGAKELPGTKEKVYPVCQNCFSLCCDGREKIKDSFRDSQTVPGLNIDVVPELLFGISNLKKVADQTGQFLHKGIGREERIFNRLAEQGEELVYHFIFWEQNQRQERVHLLVEDVPPSRLKMILKKWQETMTVHLPGNDVDATIDHLLKLLYRLLMSLAGKRDEDKKIMRHRWIQMTGRLLGGEHVDVYWLKALMVSRFPGLFADQDWVRRFSRSEVKNMSALVDFFEKVNAR